MVKDQLNDILKTALHKAGYSQTETTLELPANSKFGDYMSSVALKLGKSQNKNPIEIANSVASMINKGRLIDKVEVIKPGFINIYLGGDYLIETLKKLTAGKYHVDNYNLGPNKKIMVEFTHANTHKLFHIGHLRNIITGEAIVRLLEAVGNKVVRANYQGDVGLHIAKCLYITKNHKTRFEKLKTTKEKIALLGESYAKGSKLYESNEKAKAEIIEINRKIYEHDPEITALWKETRQWSLDYFSDIYKRVFTTFDRLFFESECMDEGVVIAKSALENKILETSDGAVIFNGKKYGLDTRVFINSHGFPTYEGKELALAEKEFSEFGEIDKLIHVLGPEQISFTKVTFKVEELIDEKKYKDKQQHLVYGWVTLKQGKMSSREGNVIEGEWLLDEAKQKIIDNFHCGEDTAETLAIAAVKYSFLKNGIQNTIAFDLKEAVTLEGNSGIYLIYTYVRTQSLLKKIEDLSQITDEINIKNLNSEETALLRLFAKFEETIFEVGRNLTPNILCNYLYDVAQKFNLFYQKHSIVQAESDKKTLRLMIVKTTALILKQGLNLLGINTVDKM